jgi:hypothetical protein
VRPAVAARSRRHRLRSVSLTPCGSAVGSRGVFTFSSQVFIRGGREGGREADRRSGQVARTASSHAPMLAGLAVARETERMAWKYVHFFFLFFHSLRPAYPTTCGRIKHSFTILFI